MNLPALPIAVNTYSYIYSHHAFDAVRHLGAAGFKNFELLFSSPHIWVSELDKQLCESPPPSFSNEGLKIISFNLPIMDHNITSPNPDTRDFTRQRFIELIGLAGSWSVPYVVLVPGKISPLFPAPNRHLMEWFMEEICALLQHAREYGTKILIENVPVTFAPQASDLLAILGEVNDPSLGIVYDVANGYFAGQDPARELRLLGEEVDLIHLSDTGKTHWRHDPIGAGEIDFAAIFGALRDIKFEGLSVMEIVSSNPDRELQESWEKLVQYGWEGKSR
jgi:L-ribulose-5-phosphate 3-epimerase